MKDEGRTCFSRLTYLHGNSTKVIRFLRAKYISSNMDAKPFSSLWNLESVTNAALFRARKPFVGSEIPPTVYLETLFPAHDHNFRTPRIFSEPLGVENLLGLKIYGFSPFRYSGCHHSFTRDEMSSGLIDNSESMIMSKSLFFSRAISWRVRTANPYP